MAVVLLAGAAESRGEPARGAKGAPAASIAASGEGAAISERYVAELRKVAAQENAALFFEMDPGELTVPDLVCNGPCGKGAMEVLADLSIRRWQQVLGVQVFIEPVPGVSEPDWHGIDGAIVAWLQKLPASDLSRLASSATDSDRLGYRLDEMDPAMKAQIYTAVQHSEPGEIPALRRYEHDTYVRLDLMPVYSWAQGPDFPWPRLSATPRPHPMRLPGRSATYGSSCDPRLTPGVAGSALAPQPAGPLDFGAGTVLTLTAICARASRALGGGYVAPAGIASRCYFVSGRMDKRAFNAALALLPESALAPRPATHSRHFTAQIASILVNKAPELLARSAEYRPGLPWHVNGMDFVTGRATTPRELAGDSAALLAEAKSFPCGLDGAIRLHAAILFGLDPGGFNEVRDVTGQVVSEDNLWLLEIQ